MTSWERWRWYLVAGWVLVILVATSVPVPVLPGPEVTGADKLAHILLYLLLGLLVFRALRRELPRRTILFIILLALGGCAAFGAADEWHQQFVDRNPAVWDWYADLAGSAMGVAAAAWHYNWSRRRRGNG